ncbi:hypothetical protein HOLleu_43315 [Holothuria leucospilota]|uniref:Uncharacterized protein n=1 Tax=Holothuria leucospilota TaxID=206669 RepID=A0A9Q0Y9M1_HOLLE|nr:hypothetical protein HOLleu_43315 [Holothuria leucospilota]
MEFALDLVSDVSDSDISDYNSEQFRSNTKGRGDLKHKNAKEQSSVEFLDLHPDQEDLSAVGSGEKVQTGGRSNWRSHNSYGNLQSKQSHIISSSTSSSAAVPSSPTSPPPASFLSLDGKASFFSRPQKINVVSPRIRNRREKRRRYITAKRRSSRERSRILRHICLKPMINHRVKQQQNNRRRYHRAPQSEFPRHTKQQKSQRQPYQTNQYKSYRRWEPRVYGNDSNPMLFVNHNHGYNTKNHRVEFEPITHKKRVFTLKCSTNMNTINILQGARGDIEQTTANNFEEGEIDERVCPVPHLPRGSTLIPPMMSSSEEWYTRFGKWLEPKYCHWIDETARPKLPILVNCYKEEFDVDLRRGRSIFSLPLDAVYSVDVALCDYFYDMMNGKAKYLPYMAALAGKRLGCESETSTVGVHLIHYFINHVSNNDVKWFYREHPDLNLRQLFGLY